MTQKERLVELIIQSVDGCARHWAEIIADHLLDNGVIVPPCKVGDEIYVLEDSKTIEKATVEFIYYDGKDFDVISNDFYTTMGRKAYYTREAAEQALKEREKEC